MFRHVNNFVVLCNFNFSSRCILNYILEDPAERERLKIAFLPPLWPAHIVRAPVPWHTPLTRAREALFFRYYQGNPVLIELRRMWQDRLADSYHTSLTRARKVLFYRYHEGNLYYFSSVLLVVLQYPSITVIRYSKLPLFSRC